MEVIISESQFRRLLNRGYKLIKVNDIPNNLVSFSDEDVSLIENIVLGLQSKYKITVERDDLGGNRFPRITIMMNIDSMTNVMYLYKNEDGDFFVHTRQYIGRRSEHPLDSYSLDGLENLKDLFSSNSIRYLFDIN
jgi:hypothetical protein